MNSFKSFPPADDFISLIGRIDWQNVGQVCVEGVDYFLEIISVLVAYVAAFCSVCYDKWQENQVTTKLIKMVQKAYIFTTQVALPWIITTGLWLRDVAYPVIRQSAQKGYTFTKATWVTVSDIYTLATSRQFVSL